MSVKSAIQTAEQLLPGEPSHEGDSDPRWQAMIDLSEFITTDPEPIWIFTNKWGRSSIEDVRSGVATCLLEHLLEHHFDLIFPRVENAVRESALFADCFARTWSFGQTSQPRNLKRYETLKATAKRVQQAR